MTLSPPLPSILPRGFSSGLDYSYIHVATRAEIIENTRQDRLLHQLDRFFFVHVFLETGLENLTKTIAGHVDIRGRLVSYH